MSALHRTRESCAKIPEPGADLKFGNALSVDILSLSLSLSLL